MKDEAEQSIPSRGSVAKCHACGADCVEGYDAEGVLVRVPVRGRWIPVTERLPEDGVPVAIVADRGRTPDNRGVVAAGELYHGCWYHTLPGLVVRQIADVTHWMPLPAPPETSK
jgi:hypothetical protein